MSNSSGSTTTKNINRPNDPDRLKTGDQLEKEKTNDKG